MEKNVTNSPTSEKLEQGAVEVRKEDPMELSKEMKSLDISMGDSKLHDNGEQDTGENIDKSSVLESECQGDNLDDSTKNDDLSKMDTSRDFQSKCRREKLKNDIQKGDLDKKINEDEDFESKPVEVTKQTVGKILGKEESDPVSDREEVLGMETNRTTSSHSFGSAPESEGSDWPEKATAIGNFVKEKGVVAVTSFLRALSRKRDGFGEFPPDEDEGSSDSAKNREATEDSQKPLYRSWNPLNYIINPRDVDAKRKTDQGTEVIEEAPQPIVMKGRIILYTRLGCERCKAVRLFLYNRRLRYVEINIDVYPSRRAELEKFTGSCVVPKVFFNEVVIGGLSELKSLAESGKLEEKMDYLIAEAPPYEAPLPPLSGEDDASTSGSIDELALIVRKMKESIVVKDRFYKMRRFCRCFLGSEVVDFLSEDQYLERDEAIEFGRKLASKLFFRHVLDENLFEDGNHLYWFLDDDPIVSSQCFNIPRGIIDAKPKPVTEIASRLRLLSYAIYEAYTSEDGKHVDYRTIHGSEEFARYLRIIQELQRVELEDIPREEKLAFFVNLYNMMVIHAILVWGHPDGVLERRILFGDFKYVIGGCTYSLSAIQNGILRSNQRVPYNLMKPFRVSDRRSKAALPYPEPLIHFALVSGT
ncbi:hypothetical protein JCGZ_12014 [Jatropha curcas]|uniref:DEP domain-containing protein n=1 Tax=Jatropha curcas TaxID=180498 RepID=A0A067K9G6_JATCU|nr:uncharacterized protein LOC105638855 [Jatropha curcas]KDP32722.1 hypothetical protein JCGZ_12014 [Jatropha curcas]